VLVTATYLPTAQPEDEIEEESVQGSSVETVSILPKDSGEFIYEYPVGKKQIEGIVELRLEQNDSVKTVRFDLVAKKQVL
jgi:hypothetical protein